jgi:hypothetical protein
VLILGWAAILIAALFRKDKVIEETDIDRNSGDW